MARVSLIILEYRPKNHIKPKEKVSDKPRNHKMIKEEASNRQKKVRLIIALHSAALTWIKKLKSRTKTEFLKNIKTECKSSSAKTHNSTRKWNKISNNKCK